MNEKTRELSKVMDQSAMTQARLVRSPGTPGSGGSLKLKVRPTLQLDKDEF